MFQSVQPLAVILLFPVKHTGFQHSSSCANLNERSHTAAQLSLYEVNNGLNVEKWVADNLLLASTSRPGG